MLHKYKFLFLVVFLFSLSHYLHYNLNKITSYFYNTEFSCKDLPLKFYRIKYGESKTIVEKKIGKAFITNKDICFYSKQKNNYGLYGNYWTAFCINYKNDSVDFISVYQLD